MIRSIYPNYENEHFCIKQAGGGGRDIAVFKINAFSHWEIQRNSHSLDGTFLEGSQKSVKKCYNSEL